MSATGATPAKLTYAQLKARKGRRTVTHPVVTDDDAVLAFKIAEQGIRDAKARGDLDALPALQDQLADAEVAIRDSTLLLHLRALPREGAESYPVLKAEHPPHDEDHEAAREHSGDPKATAKWHKTTFGPALVAACLVEPKVTLEQATEMAAEWNEAEWNNLVAAAIFVNEYATDTAGLVFS